MFNKICQAWQQFKIAIIGAALFAVYLLGKSKGKTDEKIRQDKTVLANVARANMARHSLDNDSNTVRRLHDKYRRK